ncbi:hypothetical protein HA052_23010 [Chromobacterium haemolyticum]|uniref:Phage tail collar domain-containing protein n=2 Tax=Chromobacterium fluminis TaxID=3044269 RepID=A0ABX0L8N9_9NEIS|nr:hypothetical protein [Chromobacterium haemolyticum]
MPIQALTNRTALLKKRLDDAVSGALAVENANKLSSPRKIAMIGDGSWFVQFDGAGNVSAAMTLADSGVDAGTYPVLTVDKKGRATSGRQLAADDIPVLDWSKIGRGKPDTLVGYGIKDAARAADVMMYRGTVTVDQLDGLLSFGVWQVSYQGATRTVVVHDGGGSVGVVQTEYSYDGSVRWRNRTDGLAWSPWRAFWHSDNFDPASKADKSTTLAGYGIVDGVTKADFAAGTASAGAVAYFAMSSAPAGWLFADGSAVSRTSYANLFAAIGTRYGAGNGTTTFNLPDLRGEFIRGWDGGRNVDSGRVLGSAQADSFQSHSHALNGAWASGGIGIAGDADGPFYQSGGATSAAGGSETRPRNIALLACIKT